MRITTYSQNKKLQTLLLISFILIASLILLKNIKALYFGCINAQDFSIYQQGLFEITAGKSLNPMLTLHSIRAFNDHFIPMMLTAVPFLWLTNSSPYTLLVIEWLFFLSPILLWLIYFKKSLQETLLLSFMLIFAKGVLTGVNFPIHPDFWSVPVWILLAHSVLEDKKKTIIIASLLTCLYKESFGFSIIGLSGFYFINKDFKFFFKLFAIGFGFALFTFVLRPYVLGETYDYGGAVLHGLLDNPFKYFWIKIVNFGYLGTFKIFYPFLIPMYFLIKAQKASLTHPVVKVLFLMFPLLLLHFLSNKFHYQYGVAFVGPLFGAVTYSVVLNKLMDNKKLLRITLVLFFLSGMSTYTKTLKFIFTFDRTSRCIVTQNKRQSSNLLISKVRSQDPKSHIWATGGIIPNLFQAGMNIYQIRGFHRPRSSYDILVLERNNSGDSHPLNESQVEALLQKCRPYASEILHEDQFFFAGKGKFSNNCL